MKHYNLISFGLLDKFLSRVRPVKHCQTPGIGQRIPKDTSIARRHTRRRRKTSDVTVRSGFHVGFAPLVSCMMVMRYVMVCIYVPSLELASLMMFCFPTSFSRTVTCHVW